MFAGKPLLEPINEVYHTLDQAKKRLYDLEYGNALAERDLVSQLIADGSHITIGELLLQHFEKRLKNKPTAKYYKSKINTIINTLIDTDDNRVTKVANFTFNMNSLLKNEKTKFGDFKVNNFDLVLLNRFIEARREDVLPQTISNEIVIISNALKDGHNLFTQLKKIDEPLKDFNWKLLKPIVQHRDKRVRPAHKDIIQQLFLKHSRSNHYHDMFVFLHETGCRISEALSVKVADVRIDKRDLFLITKKNQRGRYVGISKDLYPIIVARMQDKEATETLFPYTRDTYEAKLTRIRPKLEAHGIKFAWHDLRHNWISNNVNQKNMFKIMHEMNITDVQYFRNQYLDIIESELTAQKVANGEDLTPVEIAKAVGHFDNLEQTQQYTHHAPQHEDVNLLDIVKQQQEQLRLAQEQIAQLLKLAQK